MSTPNIFWTKEGPSADFEQAAPEARMAAMVEFLEAISNINSDYSPSDHSKMHRLTRTLLEEISDGTFSDSDSESDSTSSDDSIDSLYLRSRETSSCSLVSSPRRSRESSPQPSEVWASYSKKNGFASTPKRRHSPTPVFYPTPVSPYQSEANPTRPEDVVPFVFRKKAVTHRPVKTRLFRIAIGENVWA